MKKHIFALLLAALLVFTACAPAKTATAAPTEAPAATEAPAPETDPAAEAKELVLSLKGEPVDALYTAMADLGLELRGSDYASS
ncbi:MAG: hypothetical protein IJI85_05185, partial [Clostridia bacterium]|nr:hypothetical protein [Clostridia bacterium]